jgi:thiosulfate/3-mercaptopyruvate sulfurtransferase
MAPSPDGPLISAEELARVLDDVRVIDMRWSLADPGGGRRGYEAGHIPGAVFLDLDEEITGDEGLGRHPLPTREQFEDAMRNAGVWNDTRVVVYDDGGGSSAGRLWWLLKAFGHEDVAVLDGGLQAWTGELESGTRTYERGDFTAQEIDRSMIATIDEVPTAGTLLDARAPERYRGETEPVDLIPGHIPGAINVFWQSNLGPDGRFLSPAELRAKYEGFTGDVVVYCGSGVNACHDVIAMEVAGLKRPRVYAGSYSEWSRTPGKKIDK